MVRAPDPAQIYAGTGDGNSPRLAPVLGSTVLFHSLENTYNEDSSLKRHRNDTDTSVGPTPSAVSKEMSVAAVRTESQKSRRNSHSMQIIHCNMYSAKAGDP